MNPAVDTSGGAEGNPSEWRREGQALCLIYSRFHVLLCSPAQARFLLSSFFGKTKITCKDWRPTSCPCPVCLVSLEFLPSTIQAEQNNKHCRDKERRFSSVIHHNRLFKSHCVLIKRR